MNVNYKSQIERWNLFGICHLEFELYVLFP